MVVDYNRKDCLPSETIKKVKNILKMYDIKVKQSKVSNIGHSIYSVRVELKDIRGLGTNGKGTNKEYALASGYAELMERLQSRSLIKNTFLIKSAKLKLSAGQFKISCEEFKTRFSNFKTLCNKNSIELMKKNEKYRVCSEFCNIVNNTYQILPVNLINAFTHSNGLCAGNSRFEAITQGICEIFERYAYKRLIFEELKVPNIKVEANDINSVKKQLNELRNLGYEITIKDCSLELGLPVVGLMIYDNKEQKYLFSIGADPDFQIALQRCITEIFQGLSKKGTKNKFKSVDNKYNVLKNKFHDEFVQTNWLRCYSFNGGIHPDTFFNNTETVELNQLNFRKVADNKEAYEYVLDILRKNSVDVYVKDYSILGFDTYKVYIPNMSEIDIIDDLKFEVLASIDELKLAYYNLIEYENNEEFAFEKILVQLFKNKKYSELLVPNNMFEVNNYIDNGYTHLNYYYLLVMYLILNNKKEKLKQILEYKLKDQEITTYEKNYLQCLYNKLFKELNDVKIYDKNIIKDVDCILNRTIPYLKNIGAPTCPNCHMCVNKRSCKYNEWLKINNTLTCAEAHHNTINL